MSKLSLKLHVEIRVRNEWEHWDSLESPAEPDFIRMLLVPNLSQEDRARLGNNIFNLSRGLPIGVTRKSITDFSSQRKNAIHCSFIDGKQIGIFNSYLRKKYSDSKLLIIFDNLLKSEKSSRLEGVRYVFWYLKK